MNLSTLYAARILREYGDIISDEECKELHQSCDLNELAQLLRQSDIKINGREAQILSMVSDNKDAFDRDGHLWADDILDKYAENIYNYEYQYNDKALEVDPNTDLEQTHIGPMAQDLEKVNPAVVIEDESGYKTVDTGRLALMNAGAIADLARELKELKSGAV